MTRIVHPIAGALALALILTFWLATAASEIAGDRDTIATVKQAIPWGFLALVPAIAAAGGTGFIRARGMTAGLAARKRRRMPFIALNGVLVLIPSAIYLSAKAQAGAFDSAFIAVQTLELAAGALNITLLGLNMRDGLRMTGRLKRPRKSRA